jgi:hypothetical protein
MAVESHSTAVAFSSWLEPGNHQKFESRSLLL